MPELCGDVNAAMVERILVIEFPVTFVDLQEGEAPSALRRQKDPSLKRRLENNLPGLLKWLVDGAIAWYAKPGLRSSAPAKVLEFGRKYFAEQDNLTAFIRDHCTVGEDYKVPTMWFLEAHNKAVGKSAAQDEKSMAKAMSAKGFAKAKARVPGYRGICYIGLTMNSMLDTFE